MKKNLLLLSVFSLMALSACKKPDTEKPLTCTQTFDILGINATTGYSIHNPELDFVGNFQLVIDMKFDLKQLTTGDCEHPMDSTVGRVDTIIIIGLYDYNANYHAGDCFTGLFNRVGVGGMLAQQYDNTQEYIQSNPVCAPLYFESLTPPDTNVSAQFVVTYKLTDGRTFVDTTQKIEVDPHANN